VVAAHSPQTAGIEALRALRSQLTFGWLRDTPRAALTVVSAGRGDGRSWLVANLAALFAQADYRTLVIDADMRRPRQHTLFNLDNSMGLSALLAGLAEREPAIRVHEQLRLYVIPAGTVPANPQELLAGPALSIVIDKYAKQFDVILVDTPAVTEAADAQIVSANTGSALMLVRRHHTRPSQLTSAMKGIARTQAQVIGSVVCEH
jgi:capsular exopolysaccharide synthesis family protein